MILSPIDKLILKLRQKYGTVNKPENVTLSFLKGTRVASARFFITIYLRCETTIEHEVAPTCYMEL